MRDPTLDPGLRSWVDVPEGSDFPVQNLPFGVFRTKGTAPRVGVAIGDHIIDMAALSASAAFDGLNVPAEIFARPDLNDYLELGKPVWSKVRRALSYLLTAPAPRGDVDPGDFLTPVSVVELPLPIAIGD